MIDDQLHLIEQLAEEYLQGLRDGSGMSISEFVASHPDQAEQVRNFIETLQLVNELKQPAPQTTILNPPIGFPDVADYRIIRELGRGAMGVVYEAEQLSLSRRVALKTMLSATEQTVRERQRFQHEARTAAKLHHPRIVPVYDVGESNGLMFYAMQYIEGRGLERVSQSVGEILHARSTPSTSIEDGLANWLVTGSGNHSPEKRKKASQSSTDISLRKAQASSPTGSSTWRLKTDNYRHYCRSIARIGYDVADALAFAHERDVIHRDIKPANLLLDMNGEVWVADFGLVKTNDSELTQTGAFVGTLRYMAPERFQGECDGRSDVYSLGITLYELLALRPALDSTDQLSLLHQIRETEPTPLRSMERRIPRDLEVIIARAIQKDPSRRYATARQLADDLDNFLHGRPIQAREVSRIERTAIWAKRKPVVASLLSILCIGLLATIVGSVYAAIAFRDIADEATASAVQAQIAELDAETTLARSSYFLAWSRFKENRIREANNYLDSIPEQHRNIEWGLAKRHFRGGYLTLTNSDDPVTELCLTPDGSQLVTGTDSGKIVIRDAKSGEILRTISGQGEAVSKLHVSPDGKLLAVVDANRIHVLDLASGEQCWKAGKGKNSTVKNARFSPDGTSLATVDKSGRVTLHESSTEVLKWTVRGSGDDANGLCFHPDGSMLVTVGDDRTVRFWDVMTGTLRKEINLLAVDLARRQEATNEPTNALVEKDTPTILVTEGSRLRGHTWRNGESLDPETAREYGDWFAAVVHLARELQMEPDALQTKFSLYVAASRLQATRPQAIRLLPPVANASEPVLRAVHGNGFATTESQTLMVHDSLRNQLLADEQWKLVPDEMEFLEDSYKRFGIPRCVTTLALAYCRYGEYQKAIATIETLDYLQAHDLVLISACHGQLGNDELRKRFDRQAKRAFRLLEDTTEYQEVRKESRRIWSDREGKRAVVKP